MTPLNSYILVHRDTRRNERRAAYLAAVIGAVATISFLTALYFTMDAFREIRNCGEKAIAGYERAREMDGMPTLTEKQARYNR